ncbi:MAG: glutamyl-tRNA reductase [Chitinivibrionales bacterium]|nr:glutamyl-tRNA reductase [Chitinivibrionales bacterium]MBD3355520.1 glutamyl-tRNA reductase [Chitinivibrionales bacterium]
MAAGGTANFRRPCGTPTGIIPALRRANERGDCVMRLSMIGLNYHTAPIEVREKLSFGGEELGDALALLNAKEDVKECAILSTCNRVEIYALLREQRPSVLRDFLRDFQKYRGPLEPYVYYRSDEETVVHLCRVAAGLDSMVLGEPQVFGQVKQAYRTAVDAGTAGEAFGHLFPSCFHVVKKVRSRSSVGEHHVSVGYAAVKLAKDILGDLHNARVMVLGAGTMGELTARDLKANGAARITLVNRTFQKAVQVAERVGGTPIMLHELREYLTECDIVISSIGASEYILGIDDLRSIASIRGDVPLLVIDIAVPRGIDPKAADIPNIRLSNIDDLKEVVGRGVEERAKAVSKAEAIIASKSAEIMKKVNSCDIVPVLMTIRQKAEEIRREGLEKAIDGLAVSGIDREKLETLTKSIVNRILFHSEEHMRDYSNSIKHG